MDWIEFAVYTDNIEIAYGALLSAGLSEVSIEEGEESVRAHLDALSPYWDYADPTALCARRGPCVKAYIADIPENQKKRAQAREAVQALAGFVELRIEETRVSDEDWANNWKRYFKPIPIGERLLICPPWESAQSWPGRLMVSIDPGMAFGTGEHHTTRLCLLLLEQYIKGNERILDIGCGSGILSIAGLLLGAKSAVCADIDPAAMKAAGDNAKANGVSNISLYTGDVLSDDGLIDMIKGEYDIVFANIVADVVIALCPLIKGLLSPSGVFICSGIIDERAIEVRAALIENGLTVMDEKRSGKDAQADETEWVAFCCGIL